MQETCPYCGDEILADAFTRDDRVFCSQECLDAFYDEEAFDYSDPGYDGFG